MDAILLHILSITPGNFHGQIVAQWANTQYTFGHACVVAKPSFLLLLHFVGSVATHVEGGRGVSWRTPHKLPAFAQSKLARTMKAVMENRLVVWTDEYGDFEFRRELVVANGGLRC